MCQVADNQLSETIRLLAVILSGCNGTAFSWHYRSELSTIVLGGLIYIVVMNRRCMAEGTELFHFTLR